MCCVLASSAYSAYCLYAEDERNYVAEFCDSGSAWPVMAEHVAEALAKGLVGNEGFSRIGGDTKEQVNWGMVNRANGTSGYFSLMGKEAYAYAVDMENPDLFFPTWQNGLGERAALMSLGSVRYFTKWAHGDMAVPYGYAQKQVTDGGLILYESPYAMPIGYTYDAILPAAQYEGLPALRKQQALMQAAVLDEAGEAACLGAGMPVGQPVYEETPIPYAITSMEHVRWEQEEGRLVVEEAGGRITIAFEAEKDAETYLRLRGLDIEGTWYEFINVLAGAEGTKAKKLFCTSSVCAWDGKLKNFLIPLNGQEEGPGTAAITFEASGEFKLDGIECYSLPMGGFARQAQERKKEALDAGLAKNKISGTVETSGKRVLCVSIPYGKGWSATVDGKNVPVWLCSGAYLGILLEEGAHQVCFSYQTPGLAAGARITLLALAILCSMAVWPYVKRRVRPRHR